MQLHDLLTYDKILIQCHDNPDADALASGFGVYYYLTKMGREARFVYSGKFPLHKSNLVLMMKELEIPITYVKPEEVEAPDLLVMVDCQFGEGNVTPLPNKKVAVIDHHRVTSELPEMAIVNPNLGSCATLIYRMLLEEHIDINEDERLATALYYGLMTDTNGFTELSHPYDLNLREDAHYKSVLIRMFRNANLSLDELKIAGEALLQYEYDETYRYAIVEARPCDPNILGIISDMILEVDVVDACLVYSIQPFGTKLSVRSCVRTVKANELASYLTQGIGNGGGHLDKAGGFAKITDDEARNCMKERMLQYFATTEIIDAISFKTDVTKMKRYAKLRYALGYVRASDVALPDSTIIVRTLEGDVDIRVEKDTYIMIGVTGEIYPINAEKFERSYERSDTPYVYEFEYEPEVCDAKTGLRIPLLPHAKTCIATGVSFIYAKELDHRVKVFTTWDDEKYYLGKEGDYMAIREDDVLDVYIIARDIFEKTYALA